MRGLKPQDVSEVERFMCRTPQGVRGLKPVRSTSHCNGARRTPQGVRGLKLITHLIASMTQGRTPQGVRGLKPPYSGPYEEYYGSHSARSAWIETVGSGAWIAVAVVALRKECVD